MKVRFAAQADSDLAAIQAYIARENPARALSFVRELAEEAVKIRDAPLAYPAFVTSAGLVLRRKLHAGYVVVYRASENSVDVLRIFHGARDFTRLLGEES